MIIFDRFRLRFLNNIKYTVMLPLNPDSIGYIFYLDIAEKVISFSFSNV
jgi:hypothetical protein